ncbi:HNH endonuclease [Pseudomonas entomophila]|uniref:HNH endonuclease signature motif containing protein n=1 Tax=Pseudomonas entomophila TaxID=312306 RepID=UPI0015E41BD1|nr:HNH endonuclease signature motif containing protein [Pseudomonas entomophila]MBA1194507.1 HNH endonuclease [Pseudomonas entomophila]
MKLTAERLRELVRYEPATGKFYWIGESRGGFKGSVIIHRAGDLAGGRRRKDGRALIRLDGRLYLGYRLAWLWMTGKWSELEIDHIDGDQTNDRFSNLREASRQKNQQNIRKPQSNKRSSSLLGVYANKRGRSAPWRSAISVDGKQRSLGAFMTEQEAHQAYVAAKRILHEGCTL